MAEEKTMRLSLVAKQINIGTSTILQFLSAKGHKVDNNPNAKLNYEQLSLLAAEYGANHLLATEEAPKKPVEEPVVPAPVVEEKKPEPVAVVEVAPEPVKKAAPVVPEVKEEAPEPVAEKQVGLKVLGKIDLDKKGNPVPPKPAPKPEPVVEKAPEPVVEEKPVVETPAAPVEAVSYTHLTLPTK
jgi:translation initiation factor IF-2